MTQQAFSIPTIPVIPVASTPTYKPTREDLIRQVKLTNARYDRYPCVVTVREGVAGVVVPGGYVLHAGTHEITVDASEIDTLKGLVETELATLEAATKQFQRDLIAECDKRHGEVWRSAAKTEAERESVLNDALKRTSLSPEMYFTKMTGRGVKPLASLDIGDKIGPIELDTDANPTVVTAIATAAAQAVLSANQATDKANQNRKG